MNFTRAIINLIDHLPWLHDVPTDSEMNLEKAILVLPLSTVLDVDLLLNHIITLTDAIQKSSSGLSWFAEIACRSTAVNSLNDAIQRITVVYTPVVLSTFQIYTQII
jgi:hypothetical protein